jgi:hypothetical protein
MSMKPLPGLRSAAAAVVLAAAVGLALTVTGVLATLLWQERAEGVGPAAPARRAVRARARGPRHAQPRVGGVLAGHPGRCCRGFEGVDEVARSSAALAQTLSAQPSCAALAVVDARGGCCPAASPRDVGQPIDPSRLGAAPLPGRGAIGPYVAGRGLGDLDHRTRWCGGTPAGVGFIPMLRNVVTRDGHGLLLVALVNPDALVSHMRLTLHDEDSAAVLATYAAS